MVRTLIESLLDQKAYPEPTSEISLTETHVSYIFLTDHFVYKVKKAVDFGFLDFTTMEKRRFYCQEEVRLNCRLSPEIYLGVVELREAPKGATFRPGPGKVIDYAVKMKRLPEGRMLGHLLEAGEVGPAEIARIAQVVGEFHLAAARGPRIDDCGSVDAIGATWRENFRQAEPFLGRTLPLADHLWLKGWVEEFLGAQTTLLAGRVTDGFIRECDGDLHAGNICLTDRVLIFDCIEFNERFRFIDTAADIAFFLMDLEYAGHRELCATFLEAYRRVTGDPVPTELLRFYQAQRAFVRGKVTSFRLADPELPPEERGPDTDVARRYFRLARGFALRGRLAPSLILTCGLMGSGKSALARELGFQLGLKPLSSDRLRKGLAGRAAAPAAADGYLGGIYSAAYNEATYRALLEAAERALAAGESALLDATFRRKADREAFRALAQRLDVPFFLLETRCPEALVKERLDRRRHDPTEISDGRWEIFPQQKAEFERPEVGESIVVDSSLLLPEAVDRALTGMGLWP